MAKTRKAAKRSKSKRKAAAKSKPRKASARKAKTRKSKSRKSPKRKSARRRKPEGVVDKIAEGVEVVQKSFEESAEMRQRLGTRWGTGEG